MSPNIRPFNATLVALTSAAHKLRVAYDAAKSVTPGDIAMLIEDAAKDVADAIGRHVVSAGTAAAADNSWARNGGSSWHRLASDGYSTICGWPLESDAHVYHVTADAGPLATPAIGGSCVECVRRSLVASLALSDANADELQRARDELDRE